MGAQKVLARFASGVWKRLSFSGALECPRCGVQEQMVGVDTSQQVLLAVYRSQVCGHEELVAERGVL